jgi:hypothetical protein
VPPLDGAEHTAVARHWRGGSVRRLRRIVEASCASATSAPRGTDHGSGERADAETDPSAHIMSIVENSANDRKNLADLQPNPGED